MSVELEAKYLWEDSAEPENAVLARLRDFLAAEVSPPRIQNLTDRYLDTPDRRLALFGWACRWRTAAGERTLTLKSFGETTGPIQAREEFEQPAPSLPRDIAHVRPGPVADRIASLISDTSLPFKELFRIKNLRTVFDVQTPHLAGELAIDRVTLTETRFTEIEIEFKSGAGSEFGSLASALADIPGLIPARMSKFQRAYHLAFPLENPALIPIPEAHAAPKRKFTRFLASFVHQQLEYLLAHEDRAWEGIDPRGVHQMRVATRRCRSALSAAAFAFPGGHTKPVSAALKSLARSLGSVRDLDVFLAKLRAHISQVSAPSAAALAPLRSHAEQARSAARRGLVAYLSGSDYKDLQAVTREFIALTHAGKQPGALPATNRKAAKKLFPKRLAKVLELGSRIRPNSALDEKLHRLRIEAKRLRYLTELFVPIFGQTISHLAGEASQLQDLLGEHQDACFEIESIRSFSSSADPRLAAALAELTEIAIQKRAAARDAFPEAWERFLSHSHPKSILAALS